MLNDRLYKQPKKVEKNNLPIEKIAYLFDPFGIFEIESLSMLLKFTFERSKVLLVQLTGTMTENARSEMGTNIFSLHFNWVRGCS